MKYEKVFEIEKDKAERIQYLLDLPKVDFEKEGVEEDSCIASYVAKFDDGLRALIEVSSGQNNLWVDAQLMLPDGTVVQEFEPGEELLGEYEFTYQGKNYLVTLKANEEAKSKWKEIRADYFDEEEKKLYIDGWKTGKDEEEGTVLAKVDENGNVEYLDSKAETDSYAQEVINSAVQEIKDGVYGGK